MKIKDVIIGSTYGVTQSYIVKKSDKEGKTDNNSRDDFSVSKNDTVRCIKNNIEGTVYVVGHYGREISRANNCYLFEVADGNNKGKFFLTHSAGFLSSNSGHSDGGKESRLARLKFVKLMIDSKEKDNDVKVKEKEKIDEKIKENNTLIGQLKDRIKKLEKFETDDDEITHTISEIVKSNGDVSQITHILKNNNSLFIEKTLR